MRLAFLSAQFHSPRPVSLCLSHGGLSPLHSRPLEDGDIVSIDVSCYLEGVHGDTCRTFAVGELDSEGHRLVRSTKEALDNAIATVRAGTTLGAIGDAIADVCDREGYDSVREFTGHGIGREFHSLPLIRHYRTRDTSTVAEGLAFTIEPMLVEGSAQIAIWPDQVRHSVVWHCCGCACLRCLCHPIPFCFSPYFSCWQWTVFTRDGSRAAQFEHTLLVTRDGVEVLTDYESDSES